MKISGRGSLEKALSVAEDAIALETEKSIVVDRTAFASRKRGRVALSTISNMPEESMDRCKADDVGFWRYEVFS